MTVKIRLMRMGKTKQPTYRLVAADSRSARNGRFIELLGTYEPRLEPSGIRLNEEKIKKWLSNGAQPTDRVQKILVKEGLLTGDEADATAAGKLAVKREALAKKKAKAAEKAAKAAPKVEDKGADAESADSKAEEAPAEKDEK